MIVVNMYNTLSSTGCRPKPRLTSVIWHHYYTSLITYMDHVLPLICDQILLLSTDLLVHHHLNSSKSCWDLLTSAIKLIITLKITLRSLSDLVILYFSPQLWVRMSTSFSQLHSILYISGMCGQINSQPLSLIRPTFQEQQLLLFYVH